MSEIISIINHLSAGEIASFIRTNCRNGNAHLLSCSALSRHFALSQTTMKTLFRRRYRTGLHAFVIAERMGYVTELLETTNFSLKVIASMAGYRERSNFSRDFTRHFGASPARWRQSRAAHAQESEKLIG